MPACSFSSAGRTGHLPEGCTNLLWRPGSEDESGLQGEGAGRKEAEAVWGGRASVAMEGAARYSGIRILSAEDWLGGQMATEGDGEASVFLLSLELSCISVASEWPPHA